MSAEAAEMGTLTGLRLARGDAVAAMASTSADRTDEGSMVWL